MGIEYIVFTKSGIYTCQLDGRVVCTTLCSGSFKGRSYEWIISEKIKSLLGKQNNIYLYNMKYNNTSKFTFDYTWRDTDDNVVSRTRHTTSEETLGEVLNSFELFLKGAGYVFDGVLDIVDENTNQSTTTQMSQHAEIKLFKDKQLEFDFVKELFNESTQDFDKSEDLDT